MENVYKQLEDGKIVKGIGLPAFIHNDSYHLVLIKVYEDGEIDCWDKVDFDGFVDRVQSGWVVTQVPEGERISRHHSFVGSSDGIDTYIDVAEFVKEVKDTLDELQGKPTSSIRCRDAFHAFLESPSENTKRQLQEEYASIPDHCKRYVLGDMDAKDAPIRFALSEENIDEDRLSRWRDRYLR